jgi:hypothetical protein
MAGLSTNHLAPVVAIGPRFPGWGSWEWVGADLASDLSRWFGTSIFDCHELPQGDVAIIVKHPLPIEWWLESMRQPPVIYCPVDRYGSAAEIDADAGWLSRCARIVVHCDRLRKYFASYAPVEYLDHYVKFAEVPQSRHVVDGPILWVGVRTNLPPLVEWVNAHRLPRQLIVLTNPEIPSLPLHPADYGFREGNEVRMEIWTEERHLALLPKVAAAIDIKGDDFRAQHKPPAKAIDFIAAGVPLAMNADSSVVEHLAGLGFEMADPADRDHWLSTEYWEETRQFGAALAELLSRERVARRCRRLIEQVLAEHSRCCDDHARRSGGRKEFAG